MFLPLIKTLTLIAHVTVAPSLGAHATYSPHSAMLGTGTGMALLTRVDDVDLTPIGEAQTRFFHYDWQSPSLEASYDPKAKATRVHKIKAPLTFTDEIMKQFARSLTHDTGKGANGRKRKGR